MAAEVTPIVLPFALEPEIPRKETTRRPAPAPLLHIHSSEIHPGAIAGRTAPTPPQARRARQTVGTRRAFCELPLWPARPDRLPGRYGRNTAAAAHPVGY